MKKLLLHTKNVLIVIYLLATNTLLPTSTAYLIPWPGWRAENKEDSFGFLKEGLAKHNITLKTTGDAKNLPLKDNDIIIIFNYIGPKILTNLKQYPADKIITFLWESPVIESKAYTQEYYSNFSTIFTWDDSLVDNEKYFKFFYNQPTLQMIANPVPFGEKKLLTLVAKTCTTHHPLELFSKRQGVVQFFESIDSKDFQVYGKGWDKFKNWGGIVESKIETIKNYKFYLCYENAQNVQGYITEKIFDSFIAGVVPVYWGADNITDFIPQNCFIDGKKYKNPRALYQFLDSMTEQEYNDYIENIRTFLISPQAYNFSGEYLVQNLMEVLRLNDQKRGPKKNIKYKSKYGQDQFVHENFFPDKKNGVFVDIGAHNGITLSKSYFFEKELAWSGICVEPIPEVFCELQNNRNCICIEGAVSDVEKNAEFLQILGYAQMLSGLTDKYHLKHLDRIKSEIKNHGGNVKKIDVRCYTLNNLLEKNNINHIDYLSIDTEGGELDILKSIDFNRFDITIIDVENNYKNDTIKNFLTSKGYHLVKNIMCDEIYQKHNQ